MTVFSFTPTSYDGMYKLVPTQGSPFFVRKEYLPSNIDFDQIQKDATYTDDQTSFFLDAGLACVVELKAIEYLARSEQCRFGLKNKLLKKGFNEQYITLALDFLEAKNYLSDARFSSAWLNSRKINHYEGRSRLLQELLSRGISKDVAMSAIDEFFLENDENEICKKACEKYIKKGKTDQKLIQSLFQSGFTYKMIKQCLAQLQSD